MEQIEVYIPRQHRPLTKAEKQYRLRRRRKRKLIRALIIFCMVLILLAILTGIIVLVSFFGNRLESRQKEALSTRIISIETDIPGLRQDFLTINPYSRPGIKLPRVKNIFVHYTANPGTDEVQNRSYFENLGITGERSASAHFIIGYDGDMVQCIPLDEIAYAVKTRNEDSISIECCYLGEDGKFTPETYESLLELLRWLLDTYHLKAEDVLRHYDVGGKECPKYYVQHQDAWEKLLEDLKDKK